MIRLLVAFALLQLADLATWAQAPHLEANPAMSGLGPGIVVLVKLLAVAAAAWLVVASRGWSPRGRASLEVALIAGIVVGAFGAGTNVATLALSPRPVSGQAPTVRETAGYEWAPFVTAPIGPTRTPAATPGPPRLVDDPDAARVGKAAPDRTALRGTVTVLGTALPGRLSGYATWYRTAGLVAAAGPALRRALGKGWRGDRVTVCAKRCVTVRLTDWCACGPRHGVPTLLDLSDGAFRRLAPLSAGVIRVRVLTVRLPETDR